MKDEQLKHFDGLIRAVLKENKRQLEKWGVQDRTPFEWLTYLMEEVGELATEISEKEYRYGDNARAYTEAIHAATLALKIAEMYKLRIKPIKFGEE